MTLFASAPSSSRAAKTPPPPPVLPSVGPAPIGGAGMIVPPLPPLPAAVPPSPPAPAAHAGPVVAPTFAGTDEFRRLRKALVARVGERLPPAAEGAPRPPGDRAEVERLLSLACAEHAGGLEADDREALNRGVLDEFFGFGPIQGLLDDESVAELGEADPLIGSIARAGVFFLSIPIAYLVAPNAALWSWLLLIPLGVALGRRHR